ncbi:putative leucine aminopeptidase [Martensiomyces pterosporus]|nr:putative leucine aminopeptidase [Martensiomyces pterosporus]
MKHLLVALAIALSACGKGIYDSKRLIQTSPTEKQWLTEPEIHGLIAKNVHFRDITDIQDLAPVNHLVTTDFPTDLSHQAQVNAVLPKANANLPKSVLTNFTGFTNRYYNSNNGKTSSAWLLNTIKSTVSGINATAFTHRFPQSSIIARIQGTTKPNEIVVISAHQDSINQRNPTTGRAPGADDDGSGTVTILEALRVFAASGLKPARSIEFHWYAGEEGGLLGSADVTKAYKTKTVVADLHFDMTGYPLDPPAVGIVTDYTDSGTNALLRKIVTAYTDLPAVDFKCGYACSDHASWNAIGVRSALPFENQYVDGNTNIHTPNDSLSTVDFDHLVKYVKIALGFIIEVADAK